MNVRNNYGKAKAIISGRASRGRCALAYVRQLPITRSFALISSSRPDHSAATAPQRLSSATLQRSRPHTADICAVFFDKTRLTTSRTTADMITKLILSSWPLFVVFFIIPSMRSKSFKLHNYRPFTASWRLLSLRRPGRGV